MNTKIIQATFASLWLACLLVLAIKWSSAALFTCAGGTKHLVTTILPDGTPAKVTVQIASAIRGPIRIDF